MLYSSSTEGLPHSPTESITPESVDSGQRVTEEVFEQDATPEKRTLWKLIEELDGSLRERAQRIYAYEHPKQTPPEGLGQRQFGERAHACAWAAKQFEINAQDRGLSVQTAWVKQFLDDDPKTIVMESPHFGHLFSIVHIDDRPYLVDLTIGQFVEEDGRIFGYFERPPYTENTEKRYTGKTVSDFPVLQSLIEHGQIPLTEDLFVQYLKALTLDQTPERTQLITQRVAVFLNG